MKPIVTFVMYDMFDEMSFCGDKVGWKRFFKRSLRRGSMVDLTMRTGGSVYGRAIVTKVIGKNSYEAMRIE
jgi:hypothetical protein